METGIRRSETPEEKELNKKKAELKTLEGELAQRELDLATLKAELHNFQNIYLSVVGIRHAELEEIEALGYSSSIMLVFISPKSRDPDISLSPPPQPLRVREGQ
jgi:hypothetical protein